jgi:hypothetical protein
MAGRTLINFQSTPAQRDRFKEAAAAERMTLSEWLRRLAQLRAAELADRSDPPTSR